MCGGAGKREGGERRRGKEERGGEGEDAVGKGRYEVAWNVTGVKNKDVEFWKGLEEWDVVVLCEDVGRGKRLGGGRNKMSKGYVWEKQWAKRESKKGRAMGE